MIAFKLGRAGFDTVVAEDGAEALELSRTQDFDAAVLDVMMPIFSGFQVLKSVKAEKPSLPVILLSARGQEKDINRGMELGAAFYLAKPFKTDELVRCLKECTGD
jgi:DNA-binding response OmpR family regulator